MNNFNESYLKKVYIKNDMIYFVCGFDFLNNKYILKSIGMFKVYISIEDEELENLKEIEELIDLYFLENIKIKNFIDKYENIEKTIKNKEELLGFTNLINRKREIVDNRKSLDILKTKREEYKKEYNDLEKGNKRINKRFYKYFGKDDYDFMLSFLEENDFKPLGYIKNIYTKNLMMIKNLENLKTEK